MRALVTGAAGFIGSHLTIRLTTMGHRVRAVDCFTPYYDVAQKQTTSEVLSAMPRCDLIEADLGTHDLGALLDGIDVVFHQAGQPGVRESWHAGFEAYVRQNVLVTQRLLDAARDSRIKRFVFASSSSVYGDAPAYPTTEDDLPAPHSPYGVTKLAAEHLCAVYAKNWEVPTIALRYFTVFGPRQRPDMAMHRIIEAGLRGHSFPMFGDGQQVRDFTYVDDVVEANLLAATVDVPNGCVVNVAGGGAYTLLDVIHTVGEIIGRPVALDRRSAQPGDVARTGGSSERAAALLGWRPKVPLEQGLRRQIAWHEERGATAPSRDAMVTTAS